MADTIDDALVHRLKNSTAVKAITTRVYPLALPQSVTLPAIVYQHIDGVAVQAHGQASALPRQRVQLTFWASTYQEVVNLAHVVRLSLDGYRGNWGTGAYLTNIQSCLPAGEPRDFRDPDASLFYRQQDYQIMYARSTS